MSIYIDSLETIKKKLKINEDGPAQAYMTNVCYKAMDKYVPMDKGDLRTNVDVQTNKIVYQSPYASYQYYGMRDDESHVVENYTTPGTGPYWDQRMIDVDMDEVVSQVQDFIGR